MDTWECERANLVIDLEGDRAIDVVRAWVIAEGIGILNIAGTRESKCRGIYQEVWAFLRRVLLTI